MRRHQKKGFYQSHNYALDLQGLGTTLYEPSGEEARKLVYLGLKLQWDNAAQYITSVENGVISRDTGQKVIDIGDFDIFTGSGRVEVATSCVLILNPNPYWQFIIAKRTPTGQESNAGTFFLSQKRANYTQLFTGADADVFRFSQSLAKH